MDYRLDDHLRRLDEQAIEDGEAEGHAYCWVCDTHVPHEDMCELPDMMCKQCKDQIEEIEEFTETCRAHQAERDTVHTGRGILAWLCQIR